MPNGLAIAGGVSFPILAPDGSAAAPSYNFLSDPNTGMYSAGADALGFSAGGTLRLTVATAAVTATVPVQVPVGAASAPGFAIGASTVGIWKSGNVWTFTNGDSSGTDGIRINPGITFLQVIAAANVLTQISNYSITVSGAGVGSYGFTTGLDASGAATTALFALADASLRLGLSPSATPIAQTFTIGEASRPGTDSNVGGASGTFRSGLGTGTGTESSLIFQTPTVAASGSGVQTYTTRLTIDSTAITAAASVIGRTLYLGSAGVADGALLVTNSASTASLVLQSVTSSVFGGVLGGVALGSSCVISWDSSGSAVSGGPDLGIARLGAASLRLGLAPSATPVNQTFTIGEASRAGTDLNTAGANGIIRSGLGTGNAAGSSLIFQVPSPIGSSTLAQTYTQVMSLSALGATFDIPDQGLRINGQVSGAGAGAGTLGNAPAAGNPTFWLPINVAGTVRFAPLW